MIIKNVKLAELNISIVTNFLNTQNQRWFNRIKMFMLQQKYQWKFNEKLKEQVFNTYKFSNCDNSKFILLLWKGVYPCEYMNDLEKINGT